ncbi:MAG: permease prefix domain 1-containing protein, partial [Candidatus Acidiferrales bacterium]
MIREFRGWILRWTGFFHRERRDADLAAEMESHLQMHMDDNVRAGMSAAEARRRALMQLGGVEQAKEIYRDQRGLPMLEHLLQDIRFALRVLAKTPAITSIVLLSLVLGIGANTAIFSLIDTLLLRALPVEKPDQLVHVLRASPHYEYEGIPAFTNPIWEQVRDRQDIFSGAFAWSLRNLNLADGGEAQYVRGLWASGDYFTTLGVHAARGRVFT